jgi:hypothetical protein
MHHNRRDVLKGLGLAVTAVVAFGGVKLTRLATGGEVRHALAIAPGTVFGTCTLVRVDKQVRGAVPMLLATANGQTFGVEVMRFDPRMPGVARAGSLAVYVSNGGGGATRTDEEHGLAAMALAAEIARREARGMDVPALSTMRERGVHDARQSSPHRIA